MHSSCRCAPNDYVQHLSHILETVDFPACESETKFLFDCDHEANMTQAVPAFYIVGFQAIAIFQVVYFKDATHALNQTGGTFFTRHICTHFALSLGWLNEKLVSGES